MFLEAVPMLQSSLALLGGSKAVQSDPGDLFTWPIITQEDEDACLEVLRRGAMSDTDVTREFEREFAAWHGIEYALAHSSGTAALEAAMWASGVRAGDEIICPSLTYWASALPAFCLGATVVFAEVQAHSMCLDPNDIEHRITDRTRAIVAVHYCGHPCDMDPIMSIAERHGVKVIEDVSHAHGGEYHGRLLGTIGHCNAMSTMSGKALPVGEGGFLLTRDRLMYERAVAWGHYERTAEVLRDPSLAPYTGLPWGAHKYRMHQLSSAVGRVQLRHYRSRMEEIRRSMDHFWDLLEGVPGVRAHRPPKGSGSHNGGWYAPHGMYVPEELGGLPVGRFCEAVQAEGAPTHPGANLLLHLHPLLNDADIYGHGKPTRIAHAGRDVRQPSGSLPVTESIPERTYAVPWFKHFRPSVIAEYALAFRKVAEHADDLLGAPERPGDPECRG